MSPWEIYKFRHLGKWEFKYKEENLTTYTMKRGENDLRWTCPECWQPHLCSKDCEINLRSKLFGPYTDHHWAIEMQRAVAKRLKMLQGEPVVNLPHSTIQIRLPCERSRRNLNEDETENAGSSSSSHDNRINENANSLFSEIWGPLNDFQEQFTQRVLTTGSGKVPTDLQKWKKEAAQVRHIQDTLLDMIIQQKRCEAVMEKVVQWHEKELQKSNQNKEERTTFPSINMITWETTMVHTIERCKDK